MSYAETQNYLAAAYSALHKDKEAVKLYQNILRILEKEMGKSSQPYRVVTSNLSQSYLKLDQLDESLKLAKEALKSYQQADPSGKACDNYILSIAFTYLNTKEYDAALEALEEVLAIRQEKFGEKHPQLSIAYINLADGHRRKGNYAEGEKAILNAIYANTPSLKKAPTMKEMPFMPRLLMKRHLAKKPEIMLFCTSLCMACSTKSFPSFHLWLLLKMATVPMTIF